MLLSCFALKGGVPCKIHHMAHNDGREKIGVPIHPQKTTVVFSMKGPDRIQSPFHDGVGQNLARQHL